MSYMRLPEMEVVRFKESDVVVASGTAVLSMKWSYFGDSIKGNGVVNYNGNDYVMSSQDNLDALLNAMSNIGVNGGTEIRTSPNAEYHTLNGVLQKEFKSGVGSPDWNGTFTLTNGTFLKQ